MRQTTITYILKGKFLQCLCCLFTVKDDLLDLLTFVLNRTYHDLFDGTTCFWTNRNEFSAIK